MKSITLHSQARESVLVKIPLFLTIGRIFISPIFLILYLKYETLGISLQALPFFLIVLLLISELSDFFDGFLARKFNLVTDLGKILDPMADSIARLTVLLTFTQGVIQLPILLVFLFLYRDAMISTLRTLCALNGFALAARKTGKIKTVMQAVAVFAILILMIPYSWGTMSLHTLQQTSLIIISLTAVYTLYSGIEYIYVNRNYITKSWKKDQ